MPDKITLLPLLPRWPERNPVENIRRLLCDNWLSNPVFQSYEDITNTVMGSWVPTYDRWY